MAKLKIKFLKLSAGRPVAILHKNFAEKASIHVDERIFIEKNGKKTGAVIDIASGFLKEDEIAVSTEISKILNLKEKEKIEIRIAEKPASLELIFKKIRGKRLNEKEFEIIMRDIVSNNLTESEIAFFISGVYKSKMSIDEIAEMVKAIVNTGKRIELKGMVADKHSSGGIPGRTTPIIVSICSSSGLLIPKTSSRAITTPAGTADALEVICKVEFSPKEIKKIIKKTNACLVWGGSLNLAPADDKIIQVERLLNLDPEPQLLASILAKKISVSAKYVLIDIPYGKNAKFTKQKAENLSKKFKELGKYFKMKIFCDLKETNEPLGNGIGPALEIKDVIKVLRREDSCHMLERRALELSGRLLELTGKARKGQGLLKAKEILDSGKAYKKFLAIIKAQQGSINHIEEAKYKHNIKAGRNGRIIEIKIQELNRLARIAGCPLDKYSGLYLHKHLNEKTKKNELLLTIYSESKIELREAVKYYKKFQPIKIK